MQKLVLASANPGKLAEFSRILAPLGIAVVSMREAGFSGDIAETGQTFAENAELKARAVAEAVGLPAVADDSGLCVDFLGGRPGVYSARYLGEQAPYSAKIGGLLAEMRGCPDIGRTARFAAAVAFARPDGFCRVFEAACEGEIGHRSSGVGGFGYDPIFYVNGRSFADLAPAEKDAVSHRGKALHLLAVALPKLVHTDITEE